MSVRMAGHAVKVGKEPGVTRAITGIRIQDRPPVLILDTPGVLVPAGALNPLSGLKLALTGC